MNSKLSVSLAMILACAAASAQQDYFHRPSPYTGTTLLTLAEFEEVRVELKTTPEINAREDAILVRLQRDLDEAIQTALGDYSTLRVKREEIGGRYDEELVKILNADQVSRLKQLFIQYNGALAILNPVLARDLLLTEAQKFKMQLAQTDNLKLVKDVYIKTSVPAEIQKSIQNLKASLQVKLLAELNAVQRAKYQSLQGTHFEFKKAETIQ